MTGTFSYVWDRQTECWQIVSRSGHIVYQSEVKEHVRLMCQQLQGRSGRRNASPQASSAILSERNAFYAARSTAPAHSSPKNRLATFNWPVLVTALGLIMGATLAMVPPRKPAARVMAGEVFRATLPVQPADAYQVVWQTEMQERHVRVAKPVIETKQVKQRVKVLRPIVETQEREETVLVRRPVIETSVRYEKFTVNEPVTVYETQKVDQGQWTPATVAAPIQSKTSFRWVPGGYSTDAQTGVTSWKLPMFRFVKEPLPVVHQAQRVWQPNVVQTQVPRTTYRQRIETRPVQVQTVRYVEEKQIRKVPVQVKRMVEEEEVRSIPMTTERITYVDRVERVPVKVCRRVPVGQAKSESADRSVERRESTPKTLDERGESSAPQSESKSDPKRPQPRSRSRLQPEMRLLETEQVAQQDVPHSVDAQ